MKDKKEKFLSLFKQKSLINLLYNSGSFELLCEKLTEEEIDILIDNNVIFIRSCAPSSTIDLENLIINGKLTLINFDTNYFKLLLPEEVIAILLHEIGHIFNKDVKRMEGESKADAFACRKGYSKWIISSLEKGVQKGWLGFDKVECDARIFNIKGNLLKSDL